MYAPKALPSGELSLKVTERVSWEITLRKEEF